ncbi:hypothetical protein P344_03055 [Spiroplasma mirum ATCC 29335]|uniref:Uncharacterized protein n=1 Tax=Spiroplasma mirum ATCC 29335 TaxID=838561 RepID=W6AMK0_9MOLU|nr:hypothetical protein P344_03055 [Spiroplasma mirum ATCC 29335]
MFSNTDLIILYQVLKPTTLVETNKVTLYKIKAKTFKAVIRR